MTISSLHLLALQSGQGMGPTMLIIQLGLIALVFYFLIIRPQSQARKRHQALLENLKKGDDIVTSGGLVGTVGKIDGDRVTVQSGPSELIVQRQRIVQVGDAVASGGDR